MRLGAITAVGAGLLAVMIPAYAVSFHKVYGQGSQRSSWTTPEREFAGAEMAQLDTALFLAARKALPPSATYAIVVGKEGVSTLADDAAPSFAQYALLPRHLLAHPQDAEWILAVGADIRSAGVPVTGIVEVAPHLAYARVRR